MVTRIWDYVFCCVILLAITFGWALDEFIDSNDDHVLPDAPASSHVCGNVSISSFPVLIVVSFDGFRFNYMQRPGLDLSNLNYLKKHGTWVPYMKNQFVTKTFPNHMSIATGLYVETHGIVDNWVFDPLLNKTLNATDDEFWTFSNDVVPLWILNEWAGNGRHSGVMMWPGGDHKYGTNLTLPHNFTSWDMNVTFNSRIDQVVKWITDPKDPVNIVFMYFEEPDEIAHGFGPESINVTRQIAQLDNTTGYLINRLKQLCIFDRVNLVLLSDHGFEEVRQTHIINTTSMVSPSLYRRFGSSPVLHILPIEGKEEEVYNGFLKGSQETEHFKVYRKSDIPEHWHYKQNRRIMPIILVANLGYVFDDFYDTLKSYNDKYHLQPSPERVYGAHGYDNLAIPMHPFFLAHGPMFRVGHEMSPFENIDLFSLFCKFVGIHTPPNNGSLVEISLVLRHRGFGIGSAIGWVFGASIIIGITLLLGIMSLMASRRRRHHPLVEESGYRFINKREPRLIEDGDHDSAGSRLLGNGMQSNVDQEEYESLLNASSTEEV